MTFRQLTEGECGQSNPIQQLTQHVTRDHANQEIIPHSSTFGCSYDNPMNPQTFRMEDLMHEMNEIEQSPTLHSITNHLPDHTWNYKYNTPSTQENHQATQEQFYNEWNSIQQNNYYLRPYYGFPDPQQSIYFQQEQQVMSEFLPEEIDESQNEFQNSCNTIDGKYKVIQFWERFEQMEKLQNKDDEESQEEIIDSSEDARSTSISWDGCSIEYEFKETDLILDTNPNLFYKFEKTYVKKYRNLNEDNKDESYPYAKNIEMIEHSTAYEEGERALEDGNIRRAILCFEAAVQQDPNDVNKWSKLCEAFYQFKEFHIAGLIADHSLKLVPNNHLALFHKARLYHARGKYYKSCQYFIKWLKNHELYSDIVPRLFKMSDKTKLDDDTLNDIKRMFIKAAQRNPTNPDVDVQACLGMLCLMSKEYEKAADCLGVISNDNPESRKSINAKLKMADCLFFADQPSKALAVLVEAAQTQRMRSRHKAYCKIGFIYMYLKNYQKAALFLAKGLKVWWDSKSEFEVPERRLRKHFARLSLCTELLQKTNQKRKNSMDFQETLPEFMKSYYENYLTSSAVRENI